MIGKPNKKREIPREDLEAAGRQIGEEAEARAQAPGMQAWRAQKEKERERADRSPAERAAVARDKASARRRW